MISDPDKQYFREFEQWNFSHLWQLSRYYSSTEITQILLASTNTPSSLKKKYFTSLADGFVDFVNEYDLQEKYNVYVQRHNDIIRSLLKSSFQNTKERINYHAYDKKYWKSLWWKSYKLAHVSDPSHERYNIYTGKDIQDAITLLCNAYFEKEGDYYEIIYSYINKVGEHKLLTAIKNIRENNSSDEQNNNIPEEKTHIWDIKKKITAYIYHTIGRENNGQLLIPFTNLYPHFWRKHDKQLSIPFEE